ncbi:hypothetical protein [uncultured Microscilla sp.]|uniref:hypothetical protein n=1 Tax=uncultured Microscilla sp. TaxID=432653 RepID=UPI00260A8780|nr:hypothetical protein [uncultured Microscilla sp.]
MQNLPPPLIEKEAQQLWSTYSHKHSQKFWLKYEQLLANQKAKNTTRPFRLYTSSLKLLWFPRVLGFFLVLSIICLVSLLTLTGLLLLVTYLFWAWLYVRWNDHVFQLDDEGIMVYKAKVAYQKIAWTAIQSIELSEEGKGYYLRVVTDQGRANIRAALSRTQRTHLWKDIKQCMNKNAPKE